MTNMLCNWEKALLFAAALKHSRDWLKTLSISMRRLKFWTIKPSGWRLSNDVCEYHAYICSTMIDIRDSHVMWCKCTSGRLLRHNHTSATTPAIYWKMPQYQLLKNQLAGSKPKVNGEMDSAHSIACRSPFQLTLDICAANYLNCCVQCYCVSC